MAAQLGVSGTRAERLAAAAKTKDRNRKIALGLLLGVFVVILAVELPSVLGKLSPSSGGTSGSTTPSNPTVPATPSAVLQQQSKGPSLTQFQKLAAKDPFVSQIKSGAGGSTAPASKGGTGALRSGPPVRLKNFVAKDPFVAQVSTPSATVASASATKAAAASAPASTASSSPASGYVVVLNSVPPTHGQKAASLAVVAAENAGLLDVKSAVLPNSGGALDIYTGPFATQADAQTQLIRALRDGYTQATVTGLHPASSQ